MSFLNFSQRLMVQVVDTGEKLDLGAIRPSKSGELQHVRVAMAAFGDMQGSVSARVGLHLSNDFTAAYALSNAFFLTSVEARLAGTPTDYWLGEIRFDFARPNINKNITYRLSLQLTGYTRSGETFWVGAIRDYPFPNKEVAVPGNYATLYPARTQLFSLQEPG